MLGQAAWTRDALVSLSSVGAGLVDGMPHSKGLLTKINGIESIYCPSDLGIGGTNFVSSTSFLRL